MIARKHSLLCVNCQDCSAKIDMFKLLSDEEAQIINTNRFKVSFHRGETIIKQGTSLTHVLSVIDGYAKMTIEGSQQRNLLLGIAKKPALLGGPGLFTDCKNHCTITAISDVTVCFIEIEKLREILSRNPVFNEQFIAFLNQDTIRLYRKMLSLTQKHMHGNIADALLYLSEEVYKNHSFNLLISRQDLADMAAISKDSAIRILREFEKDGIISIDNKHIDIILPEALKEISLHG